MPPYTTSCTAPQQTHTRASLAVASVARVALAPGEAVHIGAARVRIAARIRVARVYSLSWPCARACARVRRCCRCGGERERDRLRADSRRRSRYGRSGRYHSCEMCMGM